MGKPFEKELENVSSTFEWALNQDTSKFEERIKTSLHKPLIAIGSGGSLSACSYAVLLHQQFGGIAKALTPLELNYSKSVIKDINLLFISASGKNTDILFGFKKSIEQEPANIINVCMRHKTPLAKLSEQYTISRTFEYDIPVGKDGFLATNSLVAFFAVLFKAYTNQEVNKKFSIGPDKTFLKELKDFINKVSPIHTFITLYGGWGQPIAVDIESKFAEAALADVFISDYRNFGHGRHHWFAKRGKQSAIIAIVTPEEEAIASKTLAILPAYIPKLIIRSNASGALASIELLVKSFYLANSIGKLQQIDPGKPGVPAFGSKLYNLQYASMFKDEGGKLTATERLAIVRKTGVRSLTELSKEDIDKWLKSYKQFLKNITSSKFGALVFDYDGTLCAHDDRFKKELTKEINDAVITALKKGFVVGIVTGRGKSVKEVFQNSIEKKYWKNVIVGYYNGSDIGTLADNSLPNIELGSSESLQLIESSLNKYFTDQKRVTIEGRPAQITIKVKNTNDWSLTRKIILQVIHSLDAKDVNVLESSHSMDIIDKAKASKLNILKHCVARTKELGIAENCLCIGDKGQWPGNDYLLLSTPFSLSVDDVSALPDNCWNIASAGVKNAQATLEYLDKIVFQKDHMKFNYK
ncbi:MAG TPA: hypothetical protein PK637_02055 [Flavobacteriales bacterium]|nr:hypothetical protein [Flavobacteriales bacterium]HRE95517.1 hypothetical protein [Flavobacteriales bacterium]HRJ38957.1 hypothetical protein [Flavobacteriales bacterium]